MRTINFVSHQTSIELAFVSLAKCEMRSVNFFAKSNDLHFAEMLWSFARVSVNPFQYKMQGYMYVEYCKRAQANIKSIYNYDIC